MRARTIGFSALAFAALSFPLAAMAQLNATIQIGQGSGLDGILVTLTRLLNGVVILFIVVAIVVFFWGLITYLANIGGEDAAKKGIQLMLWGIIALFVMVSVWGLIRILQNTFGISNREAAQVPQVPTR